MKIPNKKIQAFQKKILSWWNSNKRDLPWRHTHDPYNILISEVMLQQTQVSRALPKYSEFIREFPTVTALAQSPLSKILRVWKGMGYNRRAKYLQQTAQTVVTSYHGAFPEKEADLLGLPGVGLYTARAIQVFAWKRDVAMVDTNVRRILVHYFFHDVPQPPKSIQDTADQLLPVGNSWEWHQALMDYGSLVMPTVVPKKIRSRETARTPIAFKDTPRFIRGRIIDALRDSPQKENDLIASFQMMYGKSEVFVSAQIEALVNEHMIERLPAGVLQLEES